MRVYLVEWRDYESYTLHHITTDKEAADLLASIHPDSYVTEQETNLSARELRLLEKAKKGLKRYDCWIDEQYGEASTSASQTDPPDDGPLVNETDFECRRYVVWAKDPETAEAIALRKDKNRPKAVPHDPT